MVKKHPWRFHGADTDKNEKVNVAVVVTETYAIPLQPRTPLCFTHIQEEAPLTRRGLRCIPARRSLVFLDKSLCCHVVVGAEVGADAVAQFGGGSASRVQRRRAGLDFVMVAGSNVEVRVFCVQEVLSKI